MSGRKEFECIQCTICGLPIEEGEVNNCTMVRNCLNTTLEMEKALKN